MDWLLVVDRKMDGFRDDSRIVLSVFTVHIFGETWLWDDLSVSVNEEIPEAQKNCLTD